MGLDITAYKKLTPAAADEEVMTDEEAAHLDSLLSLTEEQFPGHTAGLTPGAYGFAKTHGFRAGSYGGYNAWRNDLARMAYGKPASLVWDNPSHEGGPFYELINFSDCEGVIGPVVAAKLAKDFADWSARARAHATSMKDGPGWWLQLYRHWRKAFEMAADGGCVVFS